MCSNISATFADHCTMLVPTSLEEEIKLYENLVFVTNDHLEYLKSANTFHDENQRKQQINASLEALRFYEEEIDVLEQCIKMIPK